MGGRRNRAVHTLRHCVSFIELRTQWLACIRLTFSLVLPFGDLGSGGQGAELSEKKIGLFSDLFYAPCVVSRAGLSLHIVVMPTRLRLGWFRAQLPDDVFVVIYPQAICLAAVNIRFECRAIGSLGFSVVP
jgi:hypothetical protein